MLAGFTVAVAATPIEIVKVQLQMQLTPTAPLLFSNNSSPSIIRYVSPLGFAKQIYAKNGPLGFWKNLGATMLQRMWFGLMFGSYDVMMSYSRQRVTHRDGSVGPRVKEGTANFLAGGLSSSKYGNKVISPLIISSYQISSGFLHSPSMPSRSKSCSIRG